MCRNVQGGGGGGSVVRKVNNIFHRIVIFSNYLKLISNTHNATQHYFLFLASSMPLVLLLFMSLCGSRVQFKKSLSQKVIINLNFSYPIYWTR